MKFLRFFQTLVGFLVLLVGLAAADSLELRNGRHLQGKYIGGTTSAIGFMTSGTVEYYSTGDVLALIFDNNPDASLKGIQPNAMKAPDNASQPNVQSLAARRPKEINRSKPRLQRVKAVTQYAE